MGFLLRSTGIFTYFMACTMAGSLVVHQVMKPDLVINAVLQLM